MAEKQVRSRPGPGRHRSQQPGTRPTPTPTPTPRPGALRAPVSDTGREASCFFTPTTPRSPGGAAPRAGRPGVSPTPQAPARRAGLAGAGLWGPPAATPDFDKRRTRDSVRRNGGGRRQETRTPRAHVGTRPGPADTGARASTRRGTCGTRGCRSERERINNGAAGWLPGGPARRPPARP